MQIKNHGVGWAVALTAFTAIKELFDLPVETRVQVHQHKNPLSHGYEPLYETNANMLTRGGEYPKYIVLHHSDG